MSGQCKTCGGTINWFTTADNVRVPGSGTCTCGGGSDRYDQDRDVAAIPKGRELWPAYAGYRVGLRALAEELGYTLIVRTYCWECDGAVYVVAKADGGFFIVDEVGGGWPLHPCFEQRRIGYESGRRAENNEPAEGDGAVVGWVRHEPDLEPEKSRPSSMLLCHPDYQVPVAVGLHARHDLTEGEKIRATIVSLEGRAATILCDGKHLYRLALRGPGRLGQCVEGTLRRRGMHWELVVDRVIEYP